MVLVLEVSSHFCICPICIRKDICDGVRRNTTIRHAEKDYTIIWVPELHKCSLPPDIDCLACQIIIHQLLT